MSPVARSDQPPVPVTGGVLFMPGEQHHHDPECQVDRLGHIVAPTAMVGCHMAQRLGPEYCDQHHQAYIHGRKDRLTGLAVRAAQDQH